MPCSASTHNLAEPGDPRSIDNPPPPTASSKPLHLNSGHLSVASSTRSSYLRKSFTTAVHQQTPLHKTEPSPEVSSTYKTRPIPVASFPIDMAPIPSVSSSISSVPSYALSSPRTLPSGSPFSPSVSQCTGTGSKPFLFTAFDFPSEFPNHS